MFALLVIVEADLTLTAIAIGVWLRGRPAAVTVAATAAAAGGVALAMILIWVLWFAAPLCVADTDPAGCVAGHISRAGYLYAAEMAMVQWVWMFGVALGSKAFAATAGTRGVRPG